MFDLQKKIKPVEVHLFRQQCKSCDFEMVAAFNKLNNFITTNSVLWYKLRV